MAPPSITELDHRSIEFGDHTHLGQTQEHALRARDLLAALDERQPDHPRVAAARKFYRERLSDAAVVPA
jgi:hypothetical protein